MRVKKNNGLALPLLSVAKGKAFATGKGRLLKQSVGFAVSDQMGPAAVLVLGLLPCL